MKIMTSVFKIEVQENLEDLKELIKKQTKDRLPSVLYHYLNLHQNFMNFVWQL